MRTTHTISSDAIEVPAYTRKLPIAVPYVREPRVSAANIAVPAVAATLLPIQDQACYDSLRSLHRGLVQAGVSNNDQILTLIDACIDVRINTRLGIKSALEALGYKAGNVIPKLNYETGTASHCRYEREGDGIYRIKPPVC